MVCTLTSTIGREHNKFEERKEALIEGGKHSKQISTLEKKDGTKAFRTDIENFTFDIYPNEIKFSGSLCKLLLGNNLETLTRSQIKSAIEKLEHLSGIVLSDAIVRRIDVAQNLILNHPPKAYLQMLDQLPQFYKSPKRDGLYFENSLKTLCWYDKIKEVKDNSPETMLRLFEGKNILRYEFRLKIKVSKQLQLPTLIVGDLSNAEVQDKLILMWADNYSNIIKPTQTNQLLYVKSAKELRKAVNAIGIVGIGGEAEVLNLVTRSRSFGYFKTSMERSRVREFIRECTHLQPHSRTNPLIEELDRKILETAIYY